MTDIDEKNNGLEFGETYELSQARYNYLRRMDLQERYDYKTMAILDELLLGFLRRDTCSGFGIVPFLDNHLAKIMGMDLPDVQRSLNTLQEDGLIYWHKPSDFVLVIEYWRHNWIENPKIASHIGKVVRKLPRKCGSESFKKIEELFIWLDATAIKNGQKQSHYSQIIEEARSKLALYPVSKNTGDTCIGYIYPIQKEVGNKEVKEKRKKEKGIGIKESPLAIATF
jgi:hypothetical protein